MFGTLIKKTGHSKQKTVLKVFAVFIFCNIAWVFFRANSIRDALYIFSTCFKGISAPASYVHEGLLATGFGFVNSFYFAFLFVILLAVDILHYRGSAIERLKKHKAAFRWACYILLLLLVVLLSNKGAPSAFVYMQF